MDRREEIIIMKRLEKIYRRLQDDVSQEIFCNRLLYNMTSKKEYLENIIDIMMEHSSKTTELYPIFCNIKATKKKVIVYGAGESGKLFGNYLERLNIPIAAYCDSDSEKQKHKIPLITGMKSVISFEELTTSYKNDFVAIAIGNPFYRTQVKNRLLLQGFLEEQIIEGSDYFGKQYFDASIPFPKERITKDKIFIDAGCYNLGTALEYRNWNMGG